MRVPMCGCTMSLLLKDGVKGEPIKLAERECDTCLSVAGELERDWMEERRLTADFEIAGGVRGTAGGMCGEGLDTLHTREWDFVPRVEGSNIGWSEVDSEA